MSHFDDALYGYICALENCNANDIPTIIDGMDDFIEEHSRNINPNFLLDAWCCRCNVQEHYDLLFGK